MEAQPFIGETGEQLGWVVVDDDGQTYVTEFDGSIVGQWDDDQQGWLEVEPGYAFEFEGNGDADPYEQRIAELEQRVNEPREITVTRATEEADTERIGEVLQSQRRQFETPGFADRKMLLREQRAYATRAVDHALNSDLQPDLLGAAGELDDEGTMELLDLDAGTPAQQRRARQEYMVERLRDLERIEAADRGEDDLTHDQPPPKHEQYDADNREERQAWMADRLRGVTDSSALYSSSQDREQTGLE